MSQHNLVLCEKPSVAKTIATVLGAKKREEGFYIGGGYIVSWCFGHLLELAPPEAYDERYRKWRYADLPIIPQVWKHIPAKDKANQLKGIKVLMNRSDVETVVNACDAGREGELIFRLAYEYAKCRKPIKRLWVASLEDAAIRDGFDNLKDGSEFENLHAAASCRERADWAVGYNLSRLLSVLYGTPLSAGRVQSPTLAMLVKREADIEGFVKEPFYTPTLDLGGFAASGEKTKDRAEADAVVASCAGKNATVTDIERETKTVAPPKLYDLTSLQRDANRLLGYTAQQTLDYAQALYEKKALSYPRTDSRYITEDMRKTVLKIIGDTDFAPDIDRIIGKVSDHYAVIPTAESRSADMTALPSGEREVFELVQKRLIAAVSPKHVYEAITVTLDCNSNIFTAKGKTVITLGWKTQPGENEDGDADEGESDLPELAKGQVFDSISVTVKEGSTTPPKRYTEDTLLSAMENAGAEDMPEDVERRGLGTPATRAAIIERLVKTETVQRQKKNLIPTEKGKNLVSVLPDALKSAKLTADWEHMLKQVECGEYDGDDFMDKIASFTKSIISSNPKPKPECVSLFAGSERQSVPSLGACPRCKSPVRESKKGYFCDNAACGFKIWRMSKFWTAKKKPMTAEIVAALLKDGRVALKDLYSERTGKKYSATVALDDTGGEFVNFKLEF